MRVYDDRGTMVDATFTITHEEPASALALYWESAGGRAGGPNPRNLEYNHGLELVLRRLRELGAVIREIRVESERTKILSVSDRMVRLSGGRPPVRMSDVTDVRQLRREISTAARKVGQPPDLAARGGGSTRRLRLVIEELDLTEAQASEALSRGIDEAVVAERADPFVAAVQPRRSATQGLVASYEQRRAIELHAVGVATAHFEGEGWAVEDVGAFRSYDLLCLKRTEELHVEVKGTSGSGEAILLTPNEVDHAQATYPRVALAVVSGIEVTDRDGAINCRGGSLRVIQPWRLDPANLTPRTFEYRL